MMNRVRVIEEHFMIGTKHYPVGSELEVNDTVLGYLVDKGSVEVVGEYLRRDMKAEARPKRRRRKAPA